MQEVIDVLSKSNVWIPTQVLQDKVGIKSAGNMSLIMKGLEKKGEVVSRSRHERGTKIIDWRHGDKPDVGDFVPTGRGIKKAKELPVQAVSNLEKNGTDLTDIEQQIVEAQMPTDKVCCNAAVVVATTAVSHTKALRGEIEALKMSVNIGESAVTSWLNLAAEFECKSIPELRVFINAAVDKLERTKSAKKPTQPRRPFSVTGLIGYHAGNDKVTLFLDRRLSARSVTLPADKLAQLAEMAGS